MFHSWTKLLRMMKITEVSFDNRPATKFTKRGFKSLTQEDQGHDSCIPLLMLCLWDISDNDSLR